jgi:hypothetical protein
MSAIYLDPAAMDDTAGAVAEHAREVDTAIGDLESACAAEVPPSLAGWLADELHDIAVHARLAEVLYLVAALDTALRAQQIQADQSLATALPALDAPALCEVITSYDPGVLHGTAVVTGTRPWDTSVTFVDPGPLTMGSSTSVAVGAVPAGPGVTFVDPGLLVIETSTPVVAITGNPTWEWEPFLATGGPGSGVLPGPITANVVYEILGPSGVRYSDGAYVDHQGDRGGLGRVYEDPYRPGSYEVRS